MATVTFGQRTLRQAHYGLYRTRVGGDDAIAIRRQLPQPTDYLHPSNRRLAQHRQRLATATRHYSKLTPTQKRYYRNQIGFVETARSPSQTKVLKGHQLFISREILELATRGQQLVLPYELCIILCDIYYNPLRGTLHIYYYENAQWHECNGGEIRGGHWLFIDVPRNKQWYRVEGEATWYYDPKTPDTQFMIAEALLSHHYHILLEAATLLLRETWDIITEIEWQPLMAEEWLAPELQPEWQELLLETWEILPEIEWQPLMAEEWLAPELEPQWQDLLLEEWLSPEYNREWTLRHSEDWYGPLPQEGYRIRHFEIWRRP